MKLLVFAHTPPPHHGQSYMVQLMLEGFGGDHRRTGAASNRETLGIDCYHVNARLSKTPQEIGGFQLKKLALLFGYCLQAVWCRFRYGIHTLYYIPAPSHRSAVYRDWLVMLLCRPFFKRVILHWHAAGLGTWLETSASRLSRMLTLRLLGRVDLSVVLSNYNKVDGEKLLSKRVKAIGNGIPDPCPHFTRELLPKRLARCAARRALISDARHKPGDFPQAGSDCHLIKVLYLAHCMREKGLFDALDAVAAANRKLALADSPLRIHLTVAGEFIKPEEQREFERRLEKSDLRLPESHGLPRDAATSGPIASGFAPAVRYLGFVSGPQKARVFAESDCFCFPSYYHAESFGLVLVEAMAFGLPVVTTRWRSLPELFPADYPGLVEIKSPDQIALAFDAVMMEKTPEMLRERFLSNFTLQAYLSLLAGAFHSVVET
jgi:glycosyltransferase involved in cell wall biosynthesis